MPQYNKESFKLFYKRCVNYFKLDNPIVKKTLKTLYSNCCRRNLNIDFEPNKIIIYKKRNGMKLYRMFFFRKENYENDCHQINKLKTSLNRLRLSNGDVIESKENVKTKYKCEVIIDKDNKVHFVNYKQLQELFYFNGTISRVYHTACTYLIELWKETEGIEVDYYGKKKICTKDNLPFKKGMIFSIYGERSSYSYNNHNFLFNCSPDQHLKEYKDNQSDYDYWKKYKGFIGDLNLPLTKRTPNKIAKCFKKPTQLSCPKACMNYCRKQEFKSIAYDDVYAKYLEIKKLKDKYT